VSEVNQYYYSSEVVSVNVGNRPITYDQYPLIGKTEYANLYVAGGTKRDGFHLAPLIGAHMAGLIYGDYYDIEFESFSPIRETINDISTCDGIAQNVESLISEAFQHGYVPATVRGYESLRRQVQGEVEQVHETKNPFPGSGIPPLMYKLVRDGKISHETF
jgi:hypothetical protein